MFKIIKKISMAILFASLFTANAVFTEENMTINSNIMFSSGITLTKIYDIHMGTVVGLSAPKVGFLSLDTKNNITQNLLEGVTHVGGASCGKVAIDAPIGQNISVWVQQPTVGSCGTGTLWGVPRCKILQSDDSTIVADKICSSTDSIIVNVIDSPYYLYVGGLLSFSYGHTCHLGADAVDNQDNSTGSHTVHVAQQ